MSTISDRLTEIEQRAAKATEGPWRTWGLLVMADPENTFDVSKTSEVAQTRYTNAEGKPRTNDADFIAAARTDVENLCASLRRAMEYTTHARIAELEAELAAILARP